MGRDEASEFSAGEEVGYVMAVNRNRTERKEHIWGDDDEAATERLCEIHVGGGSRPTGSESGSEVGSPGWRYRSVSTTGGSWR